MFRGIFVGSFLGVAILSNSSPIGFANEHFRGIDLEDKRLDKRAVEIGSPGPYYGYLDEVRFSNSVTVEHNTLGPGDTGNILRVHRLSQPSMAYSDASYQYNRLGSVIGESNASGTASATYCQDAWGNELSNIDTGAWASSFSGRRLTTKEFDPTAGLYYFSERWANPSIGRWVSQEPMRFGGYNPKNRAGDWPTRRGSVKIKSCRMEDQCVLDYMAYECGHWWLAFNNCCHCVQKAISSCMGRGAGGKGPSPNMPAWARYVVNMSVLRL